MYCRNCAALNDDNAWKCVSCGQVLHHESNAQMPAEPIPNHLVEAILVTLFCCLPFGIPAIVFAAQVNSKAAAGDVPGALEASDKARTWVLVSFVCGLLPALLWLLLALGAGFVRPR